MNKDKKGGKAEEAETVPENNVQKNCTGGKYAEIKSVLMEGLTELVLWLCAGGIAIGIFALLPENMKEIMKDAGELMIFIGFLIALVVMAAIAFLIRWIKRRRK